MTPDPAASGSRRTGETVAPPGAPAAAEDGRKRINIGCGQTPTPGWLNYDNSLSVLLARLPFLTFLLERTGLLPAASLRFISAVRKSDIRWADATRRIPLPDGSVEVIYTSHMLEHLDRREARLFLREAYRVLADGGILRVAVPDLKKLIEQYRAHGDADSLLEATLLARPKPRTMPDRLKRVIVGDRHHFWMYDGSSVCRLLVQSGFRHPRVLAPGVTMVPHPGELDLYERASESVYVEALK